MKCSLGRQKNHVALVFLVAGALVAMPDRASQCQAIYVSSAASSPIVASPTEQMPAYEVASIRLWDGNGFALPLRVYIQGAFGMPLNVTASLIGPDWITGAKYVIKAEPPDSIRDAMQTMSVEQKRREIGLMQQSLLTDRFKLKAHFETREVPVYELVPAKGGPKLNETTDPITAQRQLAIRPSAIWAKATSIDMLIQILESVPDIGGRVVINKTGLTGSYDFSLKWVPMETMSSSGAASTTDAEGASLFTAIEEQLGLKLVAGKGPGQVLVIDHIERPSEN